MSPKPQTGPIPWQDERAKRAGLLCCPAALGSIPSPKRRFGFNFALCLVATTAIATVALLWLGLTPVTATLAAVALGCPLAALYAWWVTRRAIKTVERVALGMTAHEKPRRQQL